MSSNSELIALRVDPARPDMLDLDVGDNGTADFTLDRSAFKRIAVDAGRGDDHVRIDDAKDAFTDTTATQIKGEGGNDALTVIGSDDDEAFRLAPRGSRGRLTRDVDGVALTLQGIDRVDVHSVSGDDTLAVGDLTGTGVRSAPAPTPPSPGLPRR